jgi:hypothetical protein
MPDLKRISLASVPRALELGERYRLLNEPAQAESICRDILWVDPDNQDAWRMLMLSLTDQFDMKRGTSLQEAQEALKHLTSPYERAYYGGVLYERWGRAKMQQRMPDHTVREWLENAMECFEEAESVRPQGNDDAILRWNTCARLAEKLPERRSREAAEPVHYGD